MKPLILNDDRLFSPDPTLRGLAREIYCHIKSLPIYSPHGHTNPQWFADDRLPQNPVELLIIPDHYIFRMLYSQGISLETLGIPPVDGRPQLTEGEAHAIWRLFAANIHLFHGTPVKIWLDHTFVEVFGMTQRLGEQNADAYYDRIAASMALNAFRPAVLLERFNIKLLATTESPLDSLVHHQKIRQRNLPCKIITTFRPDTLIDPTSVGFATNLLELERLTGIATDSFAGYLAALKQRRAFFKSMGATATDHSAITAQTVALSHSEAAHLYQTVKSGVCTPREAEIFHGMMLMTMAEMSMDDGLVMQIHCGSLRNHNAQIYRKHGADKGADVPVAMEYVRALRPLLERYGNTPRLTIILFTLDEATYSRELAPLASHYPALRLGPPWWFHDSPEGMRRYRHAVTETAGFYNTVGFNDDTRAFLSIPARHDMARRMDAVFLAELVGDHRLELDEALGIAGELTTGLVRRAYRLD